MLSWCVHLLYGHVTLVSPGLRRIASHAAAGPSGQGPAAQPAGPPGAVIMGLPPRDPRSRSKNMAMKMINKIGSKSFNKKQSVAPKFPGMTSCYKFSPQTGMPRASGSGANLTTSVTCELMPRSVFMGDISTRKLSSPRHDR